METFFLDADYESMTKQDLKEVGDDLQIQIDALIQGCTMTGDAHDQLHTYLMAYINAVGALSESGDVHDAKTVGHYLKKYIEYFE